MPKKSGNYVEVGGEVIYVAGELNDVITEISNMQRIRGTITNRRRTSEYEYGLYEYEKDFIDMIDEVAASEMKIDRNGNLVISFKTINEYEKEQKEQGER